MIAVHILNDTGDSVGMVIFHSLPIQEEVDVVCCPPDLILPDDIEGLAHALQSGITEGTIDDYLWRKE